MFRASLFSRLSCLQYEINGRDAIYHGIAVFLWNLVNGFTLKLEYHKPTDND